MQGTAPDKSPKIDIQVIPLGGLEEFAARCRDRDGDAQLVPISPARLRSQLRNPCADPGDPAMVAALCAGRLVGYHGLMPGYYRHGEAVSKVLWATTFLVAPEMRGRGVGRLLAEAVRDLPVDFAVTRMTEGAERAYRSAGMRRLGTLEYRQLRGDKLRGAAGGEATGAAGHDGDADTAGAKRYIAARNALYSSELERLYRLYGRYEAEEVAEIGRWSERRLRRGDVSRFHRPVAVVNWMLRFPWLFSRDAGVDSGGYYFSTSRELFTFRAFEISGKDDSGVIGFTVVSILTHKSRTVVKLLDYDFADRGDEAGGTAPSSHDHMALAVALTCAERHGADRIEYPEVLHRHLSTELRRRRLSKRQQRLFLFHPGAPDSPLARGAEEIVLDYCDGDVAFA